MIRRWYERGVAIVDLLVTRLDPVRGLAGTLAVVPNLTMPLLVQGERYFRNAPFRGYPFGPWGLMAMVAMLFRVGLLVAVIVIAWKLLVTRAPARREDAALQILRERYARGEINEDEYSKRRAMLT